MDTLGNVGDQRLLVMASLLLADELWELRENASVSPPAAGTPDGDATASIEALAGRLDRLVEKLEAGAGA